MYTHLFDLRLVLRLFNYLYWIQCPVVVVPIFHFSLEAPFQPTSTRHWPPWPLGKVVLLVLVYFSLFVMFEEISCMCILLPLNINSMSCKSPCNTLQCRKQWFQHCFFHVQCERMELQKLNFKDNYQSIILMWPLLFPEKISQHEMLL